MHLKLWWIGGLRQIPLFYKILIANSLIVVLGATVGTMLTKHMVERGLFSLGTYLGLVAAGIGISVMVNGLILRAALEPLSFVKRVVDRVRRGDWGARVDPAAVMDPDVADLGATLNATLDTLEGRTRDLEAAHLQAKRLADQVITAQEEERRRIAQELHDQAGQAFTGITFRLKRAEDLCAPGQAELRRTLEQVRSVSEKTIDEIHRITLDLRPSVLDELGLVSALRWYVRERVEPAGLASSIVIQGELGRMPPTVEITLFRILQEALSNVVRHAGATRVRVALMAVRGAAMLEVEDDGGGFDPAAAAAAGRLGIYGMQERAALLGGRLVVESRPGTGTRVVAKVPLQEMP